MSKPSKSTGTPKSPSVDAVIGKNGKTIVGPSAMEVIKKAGKKSRLSLDEWNSILDDYEPMSPEAQMRHMKAEAARNKKS